MSAIGIDAGSDVAAARGGPDEISRRLESLPASAYLWRLVILLSLGGCFEVYDLFFTGYIAPGLNRSGLLTTTTQALLSAITLPPQLALAILVLPFHPQVVAIWPCGSPVAEYVSGRPRALVPVRASATWSPAPPT